MLFHHFKLPALVPVLSLLFFGFCVAQNCNEPPWMEKDFVGSNGTRYLSKVRLKGTDGLAQIKVSLADKPDDTILSIPLGGAVGDQLEILDIAIIGHMMGIVYVEKFAQGEQPPGGRLRHTYLLATSDIEAVRKESGYDFIISSKLAGSEWTPLQGWPLDKLDPRPAEGVEWEIKLTGPTTLRAKTVDRGAVAKELSMLLSVDQALLDGKPWQTLPPYKAGQMLGGIFRTRDARSFVTDILGAKIETIASNQGACRDFIDIGFGGIEPMKGFFRKYVQDDAELSAFVVKMEQIRSRELELLSLGGEKRPVAPSTEENAARIRQLQEQSAQALQAVQEAERARWAKEDAETLRKRAAQQKSE